VDWAAIETIFTATKQLFTLAFCRQSIEHRGVRIITVLPL
jgi:hypothetical protein